uniref:Uncharacterized protein n=1 Tax=Chrysotila carterae TaxID=13221 RepID=A0A7S4C2J2_CHRCT|mmetsp:Transcript_50342/g.109119  ORF Transcript_50342/g.109119 Transcript_50342/m.109119 type:complete len:132 (+) Transcript_50342:431-826(+)|eukprot:6214632-Pleurochrysis_carterae.AAC.3
MSKAVELIPGAAVEQVEDEEPNKLLPKLLLAFVILIALGLASASLWSNWATLTELYASLTGGGVRVDAVEVAEAGAGEDDDPSRVQSRPVGRGARGGKSKEPKPKSKRGKMGRSQIRHQRLENLEDDEEAL